MGRKYCYPLDEHVESRLSPLLQWLPCLATLAGIDLPDLLVKIEGGEPRMLKERTSEGEDYEVGITITVTCQGHDPDLVDLVRSFAPAVWPPLKLDWRIQGDFPRWEIDDYFYLEENEVRAYWENKDLTHTYVFENGLGWEKKTHEG